MANCSFVVAKVWQALAEPAQMHGGRHCQGSLFDLVKQKFDGASSSCAFCVYACGAYVLTLHLLPQSWRLLVMVFSELPEE